MHQENSKEGRNRVPILIIACGALAHDITQLKKLNNWSHLHLKCLDAELHNKPKLIVGQLRTAIRRYKPQYENIFVAYADCGTGGKIDLLLEEEGIERLPGAHCYSFFAGEDRFQKIAQHELGTFYLTDFLVKHFDRIMIRGLKLDIYPELRDQFFANYTRLVYLSQEEDMDLLDRAKRAAVALGLSFEHQPCGYGDLQSGLELQVLKFA